MNKVYAYTGQPLFASQQQKAVHANAMSVAVSIFGLLFLVNLFLNQ